MTVRPTWVEDCLEYRQEYLLNIPKPYIYTAFATHWIFQCRTVPEAFHSCETHWTPSRSLSSFQQKERLCLKQFGAIFDLGRVTLHPLCPTRWTVKGKSFESVLCNYTALLETFNSITDGVSNSEVTHSQLETFDRWWEIFLCDWFTKLATAGVKKAAAATSQTIQFDRMKSSLHSGRELWLAEVIINGLVSFLPEGFNAILILTAEHNLLIALLACGGRRFHKLPLSATLAGLLQTPQCDFQ